MWMTDHDYAFVTKHTPLPCVDLVILRENNGKMETLLLVRKTGYAAGLWCIIGGRVWIGETTQEAIQRQAAYLGVAVEVMKPYAPEFPAWVNGNPKQDETKHSIASVYPVRIVSGKLKKEGEEYTGYKWFDVGALPEHIAYDHKEEIQKAVEKL